MSSYLDAINDNCYSFSSNSLANIFNKSVYFSVGLRHERYKPIFPITFHFIKRVE